jgi:hypothetical protein
MNILLQSAERSLSSGYRPLELFILELWCAQLEISAFNEKRTFMMKIIRLITKQFKILRKLVILREQNFNLGSLFNNFFYNEKKHR